jgi:hypothetical protein
VKAKLEARVKGGVKRTGAVVTCVARFSRSAQEKWAANNTSVREVRVRAMVQRSSKQDPDESRREQYRAENWEVPLVEIVYDA